jgi:hypothetical protein
MFIGAGAALALVLLYVAWKRGTFAGLQLAGIPAPDGPGLFPGPTREAIPGIVPLPDGLTRPPPLVFIQPTTNAALADAVRRFATRNIEPVSGVSMILPNFSAPSMQPVGGVSVTFPRYA